MKSSHREYINFLYYEQLTANVMKLLLSILALLLISGFIVPTLGRAQAQVESRLMPLPASVRTDVGQLPITQSFSVAITGTKDARITRAAVRLVERISQQTGIALKPNLSNTSNATLVLAAARMSDFTQKVGEDESYRLEITPSGARLTAPTSLGILRGIETFLQLLQVGRDSFIVPAVTIDDYPRFQ